MKPQSLSLPKGYVSVVDGCDLSLLKGRTWYRLQTGYVGAVEYTGGHRKMVLLHRLIMDAPPDTHVDHINGDKLDNRRANLRVTTPSINQVNRHALNRNNRSGLRGVCWCAKRSRWRAQITVDNRNHFLGYFHAKEEAFKRRRAAEIELWGELCPVPQH
jgi:hypothetical protein